MKVTLLAGCVNTIGITDGESLDSRFGHPSGLAVDNKGNLFIVDYLGQVIRKRNILGQVSTVAGKTSYAGYRDGSSGFFNNPIGCTLDIDGSLLVVDRGNKSIRRVDCGIISTIPLHKIRRYKDGIVASMITTLKGPWAVKLNPNGDILIVDSTAILLVCLCNEMCDETITSVIGSMKSAGHLDGPIETALFRPNDAIMDKKGIIWVAEEQNNAIRKISDGIVTTFAKIQHPRSITMNENGTIFVACEKKIVELRPNGEPVTLVELVSAHGWGIAIDFTGIYFTNGSAIEKLHFIVYWKKHLHHRFSSTDKLQIKTLLLLSQRKSNYKLFHPQCILGYLPKDILIEIISKIEFYI